MHQSSFQIIKHFRDMLRKELPAERLNILDVGSYGVNGTYRELFADPARFQYTGLDLQAGPNVDYVPGDPYAWHELKDESFDCIISGQAFEHMEFPWLIMDEMKKKLRKSGLICIVAPSRGLEHRYPVDCWRYYPDGFRALANWAGLDVLDAKTIWGASGFSDGSDQWGDSYCILRKGDAVAPDRNNANHRSAVLRVENRNNPLCSGKNNSYYSFIRTDVIEAIVRSGLAAQRVLDIGCAGGATGRKLKEVMSVERYVGVEISEQAASHARKNLDQVIVEDIERTDLREHGLRHADFDLVLALDVLEHLYDPWDALARLAAFVRPGGCLVASIPNIQNISVVNGLIQGRWLYENAGILDSTHLRFFTFDGIERMFSGAGLTVRKTEYVLNPQVDLAKIKETGNNLVHGNLSLTGLGKEDLLRFFIYQYIIIAEKQPLRLMTEGASSGAQAGSPAHQESRKQGGSESAALPQPLFESKTSVPGLVSLIVLTFNQLEVTRECVASIRKHTPEPHEIIFVDNGSTDGTVDWLRNLVRESPFFRLIENEKNLGFAKGCNQGIMASSGEYVLLLNNDVVVTPGWLSGMLSCLSSESEIGFVGPMTNNISGPQQVKQSEYRFPEGLDAYAEEFRERNRRRRVPLRRIVGFCMLFRRALAEKVGLLDERFGTGNYEDDDYCLRAELLGCRNMIAGDVFIHHHGSRSFHGNRLDYGSSLSGNRKHFTEKWSGIGAETPLGKRLLALQAAEKARELYRNGRTDNAVEYLIQGMRSAPGDRNLYYVLADILIDAKQFSHALDALREMSEDGRDWKWHALAGYC